MADTLHAFPSKSHLLRSKTMNSPSTLSSKVSKDVLEGLHEQVMGIRAVRNPSAQLQRCMSSPHGTSSPTGPNSPRFSFLSGRQASIGLGWTEVVDKSEGDESHVEIHHQTMSAAPKTIQELPDQCLVLIMTRAARSVFEWVLLKRVCKRWLSLADKALTSLVVRPPRGVAGLTEALIAFPNLKSLQISVSSVNGITNADLRSIGRNCPQLHSLHLSYPEEEEANVVKETTIATWQPIDGSENPALQRKGIVLVEGLDGIFENCLELHELTVAATWHSSTGLTHQKISVPESLGNLQELLSLALHSRLIAGLPETLGSLQNLKELSLGGCNGIKKLPEALGRLQSLNSLDLRCCISLTLLPESLGSLTALVSLNCQGCTGLQSLPESLGGASSLTEIELQGCESLLALPDSIGCLTELRSLRLKGCDSLEYIPDSVRFLSFLNFKDMAQSVAVYPFGTPECR